MEKTGAKEKLLKNGARYLLYFLAVSLTPFLGKGVAPLFRWVGYSQMVLFFEELFTLLFWIAEMFIILSVEGKLKRKAAEKVQTDKGEEDVFERQPSAAGKREKKIQTEKPTRALLPMRNVLVLMGISVVCILVLSAQIGFHVRPFYEITGTVYDMLNSIGTLAKHVVKCVWIVWFIKLSQVIAKDLACLREGEAEQKWVYWFSYICLVLVFGFYDVIVSGFSLGFAITYLALFYPTFIAIDSLMEGQGIKSYLLIVLIYIF